MNVVLALVSFDYRTKATVSAENDVYDGLAYGLDVLGEELAATTVSKSYVDDVIESLRDPLLVVDREGVVLTANSATIVLTRRQRDELIGQRIQSLIPRAAARGGDRLRPRARTPSARCRCAPARPSPYR